MHVPCFADTVAAPSALYNTNSGSNGGNRGGLVSTAQSYLASLPVPSISLFGRRNAAPAGEGYAALPGDEMEMSTHSSHGARNNISTGAARVAQGTEMVSMSAYPAQYSPLTLSAAAAASTQQAQPVQVMMVPVTARPVNYISMV